MKEMINSMRTSSLRKRGTRSLTRTRSSCTELPCVLISEEKTPLLHHQVYSDGLGESMVPLP